MKRAFITLTLILTSFVNIYCQTEEEKSVKEFSSGQRNKFSSNGEGKSQGLKIHIKYPKSWTSKEGDRPHVLRKFVQSDNYALAIVVVQKAEKEFSQAEINELMTTEGLQSSLPKGGLYISSNPNLKIDNLKAGSIEYSLITERVDKKLYTHVLQYVVIYKDYILTLQFSVADINGLNAVAQSKATVDKRYKIIYPLFWEMFNNLVIDNVWTDK